MRKVRILIPGHKPRDVFVRPGETMLGLFKRLHTKSWPLLKAQDWYQNSKKVESIGTIIRDGDVLAGVPSMGGRSNPIAYVEIYGGRGPGRGYPLAFHDWMTLEEALDFAPAHIKASAATAMAWEFKKGEQKHLRPHARHIKLVDGITLVPHSIRVLLKGYGGSITFPIKFGETLAAFMLRCGNEQFPLHTATRPFLRANAHAAIGEPIRNPHLCELEPGMDIVLEGAKAPSHHIINPKQSRAYLDGLKAGQLHKPTLEKYVQQITEGMLVPPPHFFIIADGHKTKYSFTEGESLADVLARCPISADDLNGSISWRWTQSTIRNISSYPENINLLPGMVIRAHRGSQA
jgi:hypothetical protein